MESFFAVHSGSAGTGFWMRNQSRPGVLCRVQYSRGWSLRICTPERMMKISRNRLKKCCTPTQIGNPGWRTASAEATVPGLVAMKCCTPLISRSPLPIATATIRTTNPIGSSHSRLNHLLCPIRTRGAMPCATGTEPAHVLGSTTSSPIVSCDRKLATARGVTLDADASDDSTRPWSTGGMPLASPG